MSDLRLSGMANNAIYVYIYIHLAESCVEHTSTLLQIYKQYHYLGIPSIHVGMIFISINEEEKTFLNCADFNNDD